MKAYVFLAEGFEEIEAVAPIDMMRRAGIEVATVGVTGKTVTGSHGIPVVADVDGSGFALPEDAALVMLPGGGPGTQNLSESPLIKAVLAGAGARDIYIAAICAAPTVLDAAGLLAGRRATAFPDCLGRLASAGAKSTAVVEVDGKIITGRSAGVALAFGHALVSALAGKDKADAVLAAMYP